MNLFITGVSRGIGRSLAEQALQKGHRVFGTVRTPGTAPTGVEEHVLDIRDFAGMRALAEKLASQVDSLVLNAGVGHFLRPSDPKAADKAIEMLEVNVTGAIAAAYFWAHQWIALSDRAPRSITLISSLAAGRGLPRSSVYCASKLAELSFAQGFARDVEKEGIRVTTVQPGFVDTDLSRPNPNRPFLITAEDAAARILRGIARGQEFVVFPRALAWGAWVLNQILPYGVFRALSRMMLRRGWV